MDRAPSRITASGPTSSGSTINILGAGPAGSLAAATALREGASVDFVERSRSPRHKVCGEFLSPEIAPVLERAGLLESFLEARPFPIRRMSLHFGSREKSARLPECAWGLSRYTFDHLLRCEALRLGARQVEGFAGPPHVIACGRRSGPQPRHRRLFGFKAHYEGPVDDAVELFFSDQWYVGINCVEAGRTNVCGLAPEELLRQHGFEPEALLHKSPQLDARVAPLHRVTEWFFTGPLQYGQHWASRDAWLAGDALSFVDPFTGSGLLSAALTGSLAGLHAARRIPVEDHLRTCRAAIGKPFVFSSLLRSIAGTDWAGRLVRFVPGEWLYRLTRPAVR